MAELVGNFDVQVQQLLINSQNQAQNEQAQEGVHDSERRAIEKKLEQRKAELKQNQSSKESFQIDQRLQQRWNEAVNGKLGPDAQRWAQNPDLQQKLTAAQKRMFLESMGEDGPRAQKAAAALNRLVETPAFAKAVPTSQAAGTLQAGLLENPRLEQPVQQVLESRF
ncbi:MAG TPA: hypothetical protein VFH51_03765, partial [Myxococcota bacterium]|nr:hypothetical protein [Myxococcota bacterium]